MMTLPTIDEMSRALQAGDGSYDGVFYFAVRTTGVFCRPSCPARKARPENVEYFASADDAIAAGHRACRRCHPHALGRPPQWVRTLLERIADGSGERLHDDDLRALGIDPARARRYFNRHYGMTFQEYQRRHGLGRTLDNLRRGQTLDVAPFDGGYSSHSGFRDAFRRTFGATPGRVSEAAAVFTRTIESPIGPLLLAATDQALCTLAFNDGEPVTTLIANLQRRLKRAVLPGDNAILKQAAAQLSEYFAGRRRSFDVPMVCGGTPFQEAVWAGLLRIPYGHTWSYEQLGRHIGHPKACRAVGSANGANPIAVIIPCHRVVCGNGRLGGYGGGLWRKQFLLDLERGQTRISGNNVE